MACLGSQDRASMHNEILFSGPHPPKKDLSDRKVACISDLAGTKKQETPLQSKSKSNEAEATPQHDSTTHTNFDFFPLFSNSDSNQSWFDKSHG
jgi:hypothetical protein